MIEKMKNWFAHNLDYLGVGILALLIIVINFPRNQFLIGWDNLQTELNVGMNIARNFSGVWQEYQGLGLLAGMAHASDLMRLLIQWTLSFIVPMQHLRSTMIFGMYFLGALGMVKLARSICLDSKWVNWSAFLAGGFYMLNIGTVQNFWAVFEPYAWAYGFAPWLLWCIADYLRSGRLRDLWCFFIVSLLATPMAYIQTIFVVYAMIAFLFILGYLIDFRKISFISKLKRSLTIILIVVSVNSFWLMPQAYFFLTNVGVTVEAKMNRIATPEVELSNNSKGSLMDVMKMEGYWLDLHDTTTQGKFYYLMSPWIEHLGRETFYRIQSGVTLLVGFGMLGMLLFNYRWKWSFLFVFIGMVGVLQTNNLPLGFEKLGLYDFFPILSQIFRSSFTKIVVFMSIFQSLTFGICAVILMQIIHLLIRKNYWMVNLLLTAIFSTGITYLGIPIIQGNLLYRRVEQKLPGEYLLLNNFFANNQDGRILRTPTQTLWGWQYNRWGYDGSGFLWYGLEQPILDRAFDVWSPYNEGFYNEFSTALYGGSREDVGRVLSKYDVRYVLLDESVIAPGQDEEILRIEQTKKIAGELMWKKKFNEGFLTVWETPYGKADKFVSVPTQYTIVSGDTTKTRNDVIYDDVGSYVGGELGARYPFVGLLREEVKNVAWDEDGVKITSSEVELENELVIPGWEVGEIVRVDFATSSATTLDTQWEPLPAYFVNGEPGPRFLGEEKPKEGQSYFYARVSEGEEWEEYRAEQKYETRNKKLEVEVRGEPFVYDFGRQGQGSIGNCDVLKRGRAEKQGSIYIADERGAVCDYVVMDELFTRVPHLMRVVGENKGGRSLKFFLYNTGSERNDIEYLMYKDKFDQTFSLLPWDWDGHYSLNIETRSFGQYAENRVDKVEVRYAPIEKIARTMVKRRDQDVVSNENKLEITHVKKTGTWLYGLGVRGEGLIRLSQGYDEGWVGVEIRNENFEIRKLEHVKADGWANGWLLVGGESGQESQMVVIFYWPQLLQYLGFVLLGTTMLLVMYRREKC